MAERRRARGRGWTFISAEDIGDVWQRGRLRVISNLDDIDYPDASGERGPTWHVSVSRNGRRASDAELVKVRKAFRMEDAEEDNHHPGNARHLFLVVDPERRVDCECKVTEETITEPDGYKWTNPTEDEGYCRGCEFEILTRGRHQCTIHPGPR